MLANPVDMATLKYPVLASPKLDGVRAIVKGGVVLSRSLKQIPNEYVQRLFCGLENFDGELIVGHPTSKTCYTDTVSGVMRASGEPDVHFYVFDHVEHPISPYLERTNKLRGSINLFWEFLHQRPIHTAEELLDYEQLCLTEGYEGLILRDPQGRYKFGRSTAKEGLLLKLKRFTDSEFEIIGFEERQHNGNEATTNELGRTKRSSHKENKTGRGDLGALVLKHPAGSFNCGTGFDDALRTEIWANRSKYLGALVKVKHFEVGAKDLPRHPVFLGFRNPIDL
jgi:DNA ligase-1